MGDSELQQENGRRGLDDGVLAEESLGRARGADFGEDEKRAE